MHDNLANQQLLIFQGKFVLFGVIHNIYFSASLSCCLPLLILLLISSLLWGKEETIKGNETQAII